MLTAPVSLRSPAMLRMDRGLGGRNMGCFVAPKSHRRLKVRIVTQLRSRLGLTRALRVELTISDYVGHKQAEPGPSYDHMSGLRHRRDISLFDFRF